MSETGLTLFVDMDQGSRMDLEVAAEAAIAWSKLIKTVGQQVDPFSEWHVELESSLPGSLKIRSIIKIPNDPEMRGVLKGAIIASVLFIFKEAVAWGIGEVLDYLNGPDAPAETAMLTDADRLAIAEEAVRLLLAGAARKEAEGVYDALEKDEKVTGAGVTSREATRPSVVIARNEFPSFSEDSGDDEKPERVSSEALELTLIRPVLTNDINRRWQFQSLYGTFGAPIHDTQFLDDLANGGLNVPLTQGIRMLVEVEVTEIQEGELWRPVERVITKVVRVIPPPVQEGFNLHSSE